MSRTEQRQGVEAGRLDMFLDVALAPGLPGFGRRHGLA